MKTVFAATLSAVGAVLPSVAAACPACFGASDARTLSAYYASTILLSLMPFALIGGVILGVYLMRNREPDGQEPPT